eukprot:jgi/Mesen1/8022/ME000426S07167
MAKHKQQAKARDSKGGKGRLSTKTGGKFATPFKTKGGGKSSRQKEVQDRGTAEESHVPAGYDLSKRTLLVGEGDFSFARALVRLLGTGSNLVATSFDSRLVVNEKYPEAESILEEVVAAGATVVFDVDATSLQTCLHVGKKRRRSGEPCLLDQPFDRVVFNFPHVGLGIKDEAVNVQKNRDLLIGFFASATPLLQQGGDIHVALKTGKPYTLWNAPALAQSAGLQLARTTVFTPSHFPGYHHCRTLGYLEGVSAAANEEVERKSKIFIFKKR